jgi:hypothetical protein
VASLRQNALVAVTTNPTSPQALQLRASLPTAYIGSAWAGGFAAIGGTGQGYVLAVVSKPAWMTINTTPILPGYWVASGTPTTPTGRVAISLTLTDSSSTTEPINLTLFVTYAITGVSGDLTANARRTPPPAYTGSVAYEFDVTALLASPSLPIVTATVSTGSLPTGMSLTAAPASVIKISASNVTGTTQDVTIHLVDTAGAVADIPLHLEVKPGLSISLPVSVSLNLGQDLSSTGAGATVTGGSGQYSIVADPANPMPAGGAVHPKTGKFSGATSAISPTGSIPVTKIIVTDLVTGQTKTTVASVKIITSAIAKPSARGQFVTHDSAGAQTALDFFAGFFGDGIDGALNFDGTNTYPSLATKLGSAYTLIRPIWPSSVTFGTNCSLNVAGWPGFVQGTTDMTAANCKIWSPSNAVHNSPWFANVTPGGAGGVATTSNGGAGTQPSSPSQAGIGVAGDGGHGGSGTGTPGSGGVGQVSSFAATFFPVRSPLLALVYGFGSFAGGVSGAGGGAGCGNGTLAGANGGVGGTGGGIVYWFTYTLLTGGSTTAPGFASFGQDGGAGVAAPGAGRGAGGGGGGGAGGIVWVVCAFRDGTAIVGFLQADGGAAGAAGATGLGNAAVAGTPGSSGFCFGFVLSSGVDVSAGIVAPAVGGAQAHATF